MISVLCKYRCLLLVLVALTLPGLVTASETVAPKSPGVLTVVLDDNYPPYVFRDAKGSLTGYLVDSWRLWERKSGVAVELLGSDWATAQQRMADGQAAVIDTMFWTTGRERILDFAPPYETIPVSIYTHASIGGIVDATTLQGFLVGVKAGDACVDKLAAFAINSVQTFPSYEALVQAAVDGKVRVFCLDEPPAHYLLYRNHAEQSFNRAFTLYTGKLHRAVHKGDAATLALLQRGFDRISPAEERSLREKWMGQPFALSPYTRYLGYALLAGGLLGGLLLIWVFTLRRLVRQRTAQFEATLDAVPDLMFELGLDGRYHDYHSPRTELLAVAPQEFMGKRVSEILPPAAAASCLSALHEANATGHSIGRQFELSLPQGSRWFELSVARKPTAIGKAPRFIVLSRDISERKRADARLRMATEATQLVFWELDIVNDRILYDASMLQLLGLEHGEAPGSFGALMELVHPDHRAALIERFQAAMQPGDPVFGFEHQIINRMGESIWLQTRGRVAQRDAAGRALLAVGTAMNISERKLAEAELLRRSEQLALMSAASQEINGELDIPVILRQLVAAALKITGATGGAAALVGDGQMLFHEYNRGGDLLPIDYRFAPGYGVPGRVMQTREFHLSNDAEQDPYVVREIQQAIGFHNLLDMPIISRHDELLGCFEIHNKPCGFDAADARLLQGLAASAAVALENSALLAERLQAEQALRESEALQASVLASAACGIVATDPRGLITVFNPCAEMILGYRADEVVGKVTPLLFHDRDDVLTLAAALSTELGCRVEAGFDALVVRARHSDAADEREAPMRRKDGRRITAQLSVTVMRNAQGALTGYLGTIVDISQHKEAEASIQRLAHFDPLTGLPNRSLLSERVKHDLIRAHRGRESVALMFLDLDRFKNVNDSLGHRIGDQLLIQVARRLTGAVREEDTVSRLGGDEFIVVLPSTDAAGAAHVAAKLLEIAAPPYRIEQHELTCTASMGIAMYPVDGESFEALSMSADTAMYRAKQRGRNAYCFFTAEMQERSARTLQLENDLRRALDNDELRVYFQPQFAIDDRRLVGAEALLRWQHPELGMVSPAEFIPIAEESGLILPIGEWVLRVAVRQLRIWQQAGLQLLSVAVNLSAVQFRQASLAQLVSRILDEEGLPAECLELELTESVAMDNPLAAIKMMDQLRERGVRMSIDDFGTDYSSMSYLKRFRVHKLKIDRSFVADLCTDPDDEAIVTAIIGLAHNLGLRTIAEGVESEAQLAFLQQQGCDQAQGYLFSEALPALQFEAMLRQRRRV